MKSSLRSRLILCAILVLGALLRVYTLGSKSIWLDEAFTLWIAKHPLSEVWSWIARIDQHPPLYYLLLSIWVKLWGDSEVAIRSLPALLSTATLPLFYLTARKVAKPATALLALFLLAINPFHIHYAQENRMYALLALAGCGAIYFMLSMVDKQRLEIRDWRLGDWNVAGLAVCQAIGMWTHNTFVLFFPLALGIGLTLGTVSGGVAELRSRIASFVQPLLAAEALTLLLWLPWAENFVQQTVKVDQEFWIPATGFWQILDAFHRLLVDHFTLEPWLTLWLLCALCLAVIGGGSLHQQKKLAGMLLLSFGLIPFLAEVLIGLRRPLLHAPSLIWTSLPLYLLIAVGWGQWVQPSPGIRRWAGITLIGLVIGMNGLGLLKYYQAVYKEQWKDVAQFVSDRANASELILFNATWVQLPFEYYARREGLVAELHGVPVDLFERGVTEPKMSADDLPHLRQLITGRERVWLVYSHDWYTDPQQLILHELRGQLVEKENKQFEGVRVYEFER